jgi:hypothetical protein
VRRQPEAKLQPADDSSSPPRRRPDSPADTLISPRLWKHVVIGTCCLLAWGAILFFGDRADQAATGMHEIIGLRTGTLATFFSTAMLLAAGQLAFISLWYRSRSRKDFSGSYKLWFWTALAWLSLCAFRATGSHMSLADAAIQQSGLNVWNARLMLWLAPAAIIIVAVHRLLHREMRDCPGSLWLIRLAATAAAVSGLTLLFGSYALSPRVDLLVETGSATLWHTLLALAMLIHARHVIHFTNEAPRSPIRRFRIAMPKLRLPTLRVPRLPRIRLPKRSSAKKSEAPSNRSEKAAIAKTEAPKSADSARTAGAEAGNNRPSRSENGPAGTTPAQATAPEAVEKGTESAPPPKPHFQLPRQEPQSEDEAWDTDDDEESNRRQRRKKQKRVSKQRS